METLIYIGLLGIFSYLSVHYAQTFKGRSEGVRFILYTFGYVGHLGTLAFIIWSFFQFTWWQPIVTAVVSMLLGGVVAGILYNSLVMKLASMIAVPVFLVLSLMALLRGDSVYVCTGPQSEVYHKTDDCIGLRNCSRGIKAISLDEAKEMGRRECGMCY